MCLIYPCIDVNKVPRERYIVVNAAHENYLINNSAYLLFNNNEF